MAEQIITKKCSKCKEIKPLSEFYKNRSKKDGYHFDCKICQKHYRQTDKGKKVQKRYLQSDKGKVSRRKIIKRYERSQKGRETIRLYRQSEKGKNTKKRYEHSEKGKAAHTRYKQSVKGKDTAEQYHLSHPDWRKAHSAVRYAIKNRKLPPVNSLKCACGNQAAQYHHHKGYAPEHWLDVVPVCIKCHNHLNA